MRPYENPWPYNVKTVFNKYLGNGRSNQKISKNEVHLFSNFGMGWPPPTQSTGPQPIQLVPKHRFFTDISATVAQIQKIQKARCIYFRILVLGGPSPPSQLVPNPFNWSPKSVFLQISQQRSLKSKKFKKRGAFFFEFCF